MANYEVLGIGSPFVDYIIVIKDDFLRHVPGAKGGMVVVDYDTLSSIISKSGKEPLIIAGGSGANTIKGLANFGHQCALIGKIGSDDAAKQFLENMKALSITPLLRQSSTRTAQTVCLITPDGERTMRAFLGASQEMSSKDLDPSIFEGVSLVHIEGYSLLNEQLTLEAMKLAKSAGAQVSFDLGSFEVVNAHKKTIIDLLPKYVDVVFANRDEIRSLTQLTPEKGCEVLKDLCNTAVILLGKEGCIVGSGSKQVQCPAFAVDPVDTTGAGDLFASGFLHGYLQQLPLEECARYGALAGAAVVQVQGVDVPPHAWQQIKEKMK